MAGVDIEIGDQRVRFHESRYAEKGTRPRVSGIFYHIAGLHRLSFI